MLAYRYSERQQLIAPRAPHARLPEGVAEVLQVLRSAAIIVDAKGEVERATAAAYAFGLVRDRRIAHAVIDEMVTVAARDGIILDEELELPRGPIGRGMVMLQVRVAPLVADFILITAEDRTEARRLEAIRRDFVVNVSHELKTPVGALSLLAETMQDAADDPAAVTHFSQRMQEEAQRLATLVHEIIELSRLQFAGSIDIGTPIAVSVVLEEAVDRTKTKADAKQIVIDAETDTDAKVYGDHNLLVTAVRNLIDNAVSYSDEATHVGVGVTTSDGLVEISVVDQGIGLDPSVRERIFERFYRVDAARSRETGGTGLGLSIVKHVVADHGGDIQVWSAPNSGSTFTIRIPSADVVSASESTPSVPDDPSTSTVEPGTTPKETPQS